MVLNIPSRNSDDRIGKTPARPSSRPMMNIYKTLATATSNITTPSDISTL
jgi:hypothetical protein